MSDELSGMFYMDFNDDANVTVLPVTMYNKKKVVEIGGNTRRDTKCYWIERRNSSSVLCVAPVYEVTPHRTFTLNLSIDNRYQIFYMKRMRDRMVLVYADNSHTQIRADLIVVVLDEIDSQRIHVRRKIHMQNHPFPIGLSVDGEHILKIMCGSFVSWIDTDEVPHRNTTEFTPDGIVHVRHDRESNDVIISDVISYEEFVKTNDLKNRYRDKNCFIFLKKMCDIMGIYLCHFDRDNATFKLISREGGVSRNMSFTHEAYTYRADMGPAKHPNAHMIDDVFFLAVPSGTDYITKIVDMTDS
jgi:hypothetical protein